MLPTLLESLLTFPEVSQVILTLNIPEDINFSNERVHIIRNNIPQGFGANNNAAFKTCNADYFCVVNPDIVFSENPFPQLLTSFIGPKVGLVAPMVTNQDGVREDSARHFITPERLLRRYMFGYDDSYDFEKSDEPIYAEWVAGMFMMFRSSAYRNLLGFDERYFLYVEDADICTRLWMKGYQLLVVPSAVVIHNAQRATLKNYQHLYWHISSLMRYFFYYLGRLPKVDQ
jgi:hypothetical protein